MKGNNVWFIFLTIFLLIACKENKRPDIIELEKNIVKDSVKVDSVMQKKKAERKKIVYGILGIWSLNSDSISKKFDFEIKEKKVFYKKSSEEVPYIVLGDSLAIMRKKGVERLKIIKVSKDSLILSQNNKEKIYFRKTP